MEIFLPALPYYWDKGNFVHGTKVRGEVDGTRRDAVPGVHWVDQ